MKKSILSAIVIAAMAFATGCCDDRVQQAEIWTGGGNPAAGRAVIRNYGCNSCHTIPGVPGADGQVGPPLAGVANRAYIAGELPNNGPNLMRWIRFPKQVEPNTVMPDMSVSEEDSRNISAYLYTLR